MSSENEPNEFLVMSQYSCAGCGHDFRATTPARARDMFNRHLQRKPNQLFSRHSLWKMYQANQRTKERIARMTEAMSKITPNADGTFTFETTGPLPSPPIIPREWIENATGHQEFLDRE